MTEPNDLLGGNLERVDEIASRLIGKKLNPSTVTRWCRLGVSGIVLPAIKFGKAWMTTEEAFRKWIASTTDAARSTPQRSEDK